jgi:hypothetical protein
MNTVETRTNAQGKPLVICCNNHGWQTLKACRRLHAEVA